MGKCPTSITLLLSANFLFYLFSSLTIRISTFTHVHLDSSIIYWQVSNSFSKWSMLSKSRENVSVLGLYWDITLFIDQEVMRATWSRSGRSLSCWVSAWGGGLSLLQGKSSTHWGGHGRAVVFVVIWRKWSWWRIPPQSVHFGVTSGNKFVWLLF